MTMEGSLELTGHRLRTRFSGWAGSVAGSNSVARRVSLVAPVHPENPIRTEPARRTEGCGARTQLRERLKKRGECDLTKAVLHE